MDAPAPSADSRIARRSTCVDPQGTRIRIDDEGLDLEGVASGPDIPGVDVDVGTNTKGNLDVDVSTDGTDASNDRPNDR